MWKNRNIEYNYIFIIIYLMSRFSLQLSAFSRQLFAFMIQVRVVSILASADG